MSAFLLWIAQGFGIGRLPLAPGTFGSIAGLLWFALLLWTGSFPVFLAGTILCLALSVWLSGVGEKVLKQKDPGSVVIDEVAAMPLCYLGWTAFRVWKTGLLPGPEYFFSQQNWLPTVGVFVAFRFFDIVKPWPVGKSQSLPGGWGVTADDALAAVYVNATVLAAHEVQRLLAG